MTVALVVGAAGFVGSHLCRQLEAAGMEVRRVSRDAELPSRVAMDALERDEDAIARALAGVDVVYHLAATAHEAVAASDPVALQRVNVEAPLRWLRAARKAGVPRFVWLSSIKVLGDVSAAPLRPEDPRRPGDAYARSKAQAEQQLLAAVQPGTALAVVRPPLVYGPGVRGNFATLMRWAASGAPLPLGRASAPRSMVGVSNLCDLLVRLGQTGCGIFHVADPRDTRVTELLADMRRLLGQPPRQIAVPPRALRAAAALIRREAIYCRLFEPLQVDCFATRESLGWVPPREPIEELEDTIRWFRTSR